MNLFGLLQMLQQRQQPAPLGLGGMAMRRAILNGGQVTGSGQRARPGSPMAQFLNPDDPMLAPGNAGPRAAFDDAPPVASGGMLDPLQAMGNPDIPTPPPMMPTGGPAAPRQGLLDRLLMPAAAPGDLTPGEANLTRRAGLMSAGLSLLRPHQSEQGESGGLLSALGRGLEAGQQGAMGALQGSDAMMARGDAQRSRDILRSMNIEPTEDGVRRGLLQMIRSGNVSGAQVLVGLLNSLKTARGEGQYRSGPQGIYSQETGHLVPGTAPAAEAPKQRPAINPQTGQVEYQEFRDGRWQFTGTQAGSALGPNAVPARFASQMLNDTESHIHLGAPSAIDRILEGQHGAFSDALLNRYISEDAQQLRTVAPLYVNAYNKMMGFARVSELTIHQAEQSLIPMTGDRPATLKLKAQMRARVRAFVDAGGLQGDSASLGGGGGAVAQELP